MADKKCRCIFHAGRPISVFLLLLPLLLLIPGGCSLSLFPGYHRINGPEGTTPVTWFQTDSGHFLFNTKIDLMKNHFSGLMVVKPYSDGSFRVVFITETGIKIFDMEFLPDRHVKIQYILDAMNRKVLIRTLSDDISLVLMNGLEDMQSVRFGIKDSQDLVFRYKEGKRKSFYYTGADGGRPYRANQTVCISNKVTAGLYGNNGSGIDSVKIEHNNLRLAICLYRIIEDNHAAE